MAADLTAEVEEPEAVKVTVCQLANDRAALEKEWEGLVSHVRSESSDLVLLPEMPFSSWIARSRPFDPEIWRAAVEAHEEWLDRFSELSPAVVIGSRPVERDGRRLNEGFFWDGESGYRAAHVKRYLPDEEYFWEATWYKRGDGEFAPVDIGRARMGFMICTDLWFTEHARAYAGDGVHLLAVPRATAFTSLEKWLAGGRAAAVVSGAWCLSSNRGGTDGEGTEWTGGGWIIEPENGEVLAVTSNEQPFRTLEIDLATAEHAKTTYPRYVSE